MQQAGGCIGVECFGARPSVRVGVTAKRVGSRVSEEGLMVYITHVHMAGGDGHEYIESVGWRDPADGNEAVSTKPAMVEWINAGGIARVSDGAHEVEVGVVDGSPPYLRTHADGRWTNNLLSLPRF